METCGHYRLGHFNLIENNMLQFLELKAGKIYWEGNDENILRGLVRSIPDCVFASVKKSDVYTRYKAALLFSIHIHMQHFRMKKCNFLHLKMIVSFIFCNKTSIFMLFLKFLPQKFIADIFFHFYA